MKHILRIFALVLAMGALQVSARNINGTVVDNTGEAMIKASVRLLKPDSVLVKAAITDLDGHFALRDVATGRYILECSYVGYDNLYRNLDVQAKDIDLGSLVMSESSIMLKEAVVRGIRTPITVKEDTVEYTASSYKTAPNAVVEDLLKRLPGVDVDTQGKITANGKEVTKILIDGKEFFSDDPKVASKNLPVDMIDKLQVVDRKSDLARLTGVDDGEEETVINLTVKKGMNNGWFGNVEAGYGTSDRYNGSFIVNHFSNGNQVTLLGGANNTNDPAFTDGGMGRFRRFGGDNGVTSSQALGLNFNVGRGDTLRVGGNVMWSRSDRLSNTRTDRQYLLRDSSSYFNEQKNARDIGNNFRADFRLEWKPDSLNSLDFRPSFSYNHNRSWSDDEALTRAGDPARTQVTRSINRNSARANAVEASGRLIYNHKFASRPGRSISLMANYRFSNQHEYSDSYSWNRFFLLGDSINLYDQYGDERTWSNSVGARLTWTEPIGKPKNGNFLIFAYNINARWNNADKLTYDHPITWPDGFGGEPVIGTELVFNDSISNRFRNTYLNQDFRIGFKHVSSKVNTEVGISLVPQRSSSVDLIDDARSIAPRNVLNIAPFLRYRLKISKTRSFNANYRGRSSQPSMTQLQPVADVSNPLNIVQGNPNLAPSFNHNVQLRFQDFNPEAQRAIMAMVFGQMTQNAIVSRTSFNAQTGGRFTTYENVNGVWNVRGMGMISMPLRNKQFSINNHLMLSYSRSVGFNNDRRNVSGAFGINESLGFAWRPDYAEIEIRPLYSLQNVRNSVQGTADRNTQRYGGRFDATWYTPFGLVLNTDLSYTATSGYAAGYNTNEWMWNASISYQFLRDKSATVSLKGFDLLQQRSNVMRNVTANYIDDVLYNSLTRYFMLTFSYRFNTFGKGKTPEGFNMGPGGFGGPGAPGGPGGPGGRRPF